MPDLTGFATFEFPGCAAREPLHDVRGPGRRGDRASALHGHRDRRSDRHPRLRRVDVLRGDTREAVYRDERFTDANTTWDEHAPYFRRGFAAQVEDLVAAIEDDRPPTIDGHDGLAAVAMATGALRSWREDAVVRL